MNTGIRVAILAILLVICVGCDQATKAVAQHHLAFAPPITYWGNLIRLEYAENPGGFLSIGAGLSESTRYYVFIVAVSVILGTTFVIMARVLNTAPFRIIIALAFIVGGGIGNLLSRLLNEGHVIDFMNIGFGPWRTGTFNVADMAIMAGAGALVYFGLFEGERKETRLQ
jgi:signal peptidase II